MAPGAYLRVTPTHVTLGQENLQGTNIGKSLSEVRQESPSTYRKGFLGINTFKPLWRVRPVSLFVKAC